MFTLITLFSIFLIVPVQCYLDISPATAQLMREMVAQGHNVGYHETDATYTSSRATYYGSSTSYSYPYYSYYGNSYYPSYSYGNSYYPSYGNYGNSNYNYYG